MLSGAACRTARRALGAALCRTARRRAQHTAVPRVYVSHALDPWRNLAVEDYFLRGVPPDVPVCYLYQNAPCVVVGKNQNSWGELDARAMQREQVALVRRQSGGGAVYHDAGNLNFSFHVPKATFARRTHTELVARALARPPLALPERLGRAPVFVNERNDMCVYAAGATAPDAAAVRKVSGSAYRMVNQRAYHHGTLLLDTQLDRMRVLRRRTRATITSRGVDSVPSPVANLAEVFPEQRAQLTFERIAEAIYQEFLRTYGAGELHSVDDALLDAQVPLGRHRSRPVHEAAAEMRSWDWVYGASPEFEVRVDAAGGAALPDVRHLVLQLTCRHGRVHTAGVHRVEPSSQEAAVRDAASRLVGVPYDAIAVAPPGPPAPAAPPSTPAERALRTWLREQL